MNANDDWAWYTDSDGIRWLVKPFDLLTEQDKIRDNLRRSYLESKHNT